ncbi:MAG: hypothetical protein V3U75_13435 [Methylococcaceae bacterium]
MTLVADYVRFKHKGVSGISKLHDAAKGVEAIHNLHGEISNELVTIRQDILTTCFTFLLECGHYINTLKSKLSGQEERLKWIKKYIYEMTPQGLSIAQIEKQLGHRIIIKSPTDD